MFQTSCFYIIAKGKFHPYYKQQIMLIIWVYCHFVYLFPASVGFTLHIFSALCIFGVQFQERLNLYLIFKIIPTAF